MRITNRRTTDVRSNATFFQSKMDQFQPKDLLLLEQLAPFPGRESPMLMCRLMFSVTRQRSRVFSEYKPMKSPTKIRTKMMKNSRTAVDAVVTEVKPDYTLVEATSRMAVSSPKKDQQPFKFPRPVASKPPAGLQNKQPTGQAKGKGKPAPAKKGPPAKKKAGKKTTKQAKPSKPGKATKGKTEVPKKEEKQEIVQEVAKAVEEVAEDKTELVRVDSETGEHEPEMSDRTGLSSVISRDTSARVSSKASDELNESKNDGTLEATETSVPEIPHLIPKPPESQAATRSEPETEQPSPAEEQKQAQESRAARRAAERAAAAERRRQEVERKRREREEAKKRALEEEARLEQLRLEAEEDMKKERRGTKVRRRGVETNVWFMNKVGKVNCRATVKRFEC